MCPSQHGCTFFHTPPGLFLPTWWLFKVTMGNKRADHVGEHRTAYDKNRKKILATQEVCGICGKLVDKSIKNPKDPLAAVVDHIVPIARGGHPSDISNLQLAHRSCNREKSDKLLNLNIEALKAQEEADCNLLPLHYDWTKHKTK